MKDRDLQNIIGGGLLFLFGAGYALYALSHCQLGTLRRMGAGMFPFGLGILLAGLSLLIIVPALFRRGMPTEIPLRAPLFVLAAIAGFALLIRPVGMVPAVCALTLISTRVEANAPWLRSLILCVALNLVAWLVFVLALSLPVAVLRWPF